MSVALQVTALLLVSVTSMPALSCTAPPAGSKTIACGNSVDVNVAWYLEPAALTTLTVWSPDVVTCPWLS